MNIPSPQQPSFVLGYWRPWNKNADASASYLDYIRDVSLAGYTANTVGRYIAQASQEHVRAINSLSNSLGMGFGQLAEGLAKIDEATSGVSSAIRAVENKLASIDGTLLAIEGNLAFLNRNVDLLIEQQRLSNLLLRNITALLRVPESEKERQRSIELGIKFFINARKDPDLYTDALEMLLKAEELMQQDYFVLHRVGCIYLHVDKHVDVAKALHYFTRAGKYAAVESEPQAFQLAHALTANDALKSDGEATAKSIGLLAADSYEKAAFAAYVLGMDTDAVRYQAKCIGLNPTARNRFTFAKYLVRSGEVKEGLTILDQALSDAPLLLPAVFRDIDLVNEPGVLQSIEKNTVAASVMRIKDKRAQVAALVISEASRRWQQQCDILTESWSPWADVKGLRKFKKACASLAELVERGDAGNFDGKVKRVFLALNEGVVAGERYKIPHDFLLQSRQKLRNYERLYRSLFSLESFGDEERVHLSEILEQLTSAGIIRTEAGVLQQHCGDADPDTEAGLLLTEALTLLAIADGTVSVDEQNTIVRSVHQVGFINSEESIRERIRFAFGQIRANGVSAFADDLRKRLVFCRDDALLETVLRVMVQVAGDDGVVHEKERRVIDWFRKQFAK